MGQLDEATALADRALALDPSSEPAQTMVAELLPRSGQLSEAIERLQGLLDAGASAPTVRVRLAACLVEADRAEEALEPLDAPVSDDAIELRLSQLQYRYAALANLGRWPDAVEVAEALCALDRGHPVLELLAHALEQAKRPEPAGVLRRELARFRPDDWHRFLRTLDAPGQQTLASTLGTSASTLLALPPLGTLTRMDEPSRDRALCELPRGLRTAMEGQCHRASNRAEQARAVLARASDEPAVRFETALLDMCADTIERSVEAIERLVDEGVPLPGLSYWHAVVHHAAGHDERAAALYRSVLAEQPDHGHAGWLRADVVGRLEGQQAADSQRRQAYRATPLLLHRPLRSQLQTIIGVAGRVRMQTLDIDDPARVQACHQAGDLPHLQELLEDWATRDDVPDDTRVALARQSLEPATHALVLRLLEPLIHDEHPEALALAGEALTSAEKPLLASKRLRRATELDPSLVRAWDFLGVIHAMRQEWDRAEEPLRRAVELGPGGPERQLNLARFLLDTDRGEEAVAPAERAVAMMQAEADLLAVLARAHHAAGDEHWARLAAWASDHHREQHLHRMALGGLAGVMPGNIRTPPDVFRPTFGRFVRRLDEVAAAL